MVVRKYQLADTEEIIELWYTTSLTAHSFIPEELWQAHKSDLRINYLPVAETWVAEKEGKLVGFISLIDEYIGALFVAEEAQGLGIGTQLLEQAKRTRSALTVGVYKKNLKARSFYEKHGFQYEGEETQAETGEVVLNMKLY